MTTKKRRAVAAAAGLAAAMALAAPALAAGDCPNGGDVPAPFEAKLAAVMQNLDLSALPEADRKIMGVHGAKTAPQSDHSFDAIRDLVKTLHIDLAKMS